MVIMASGIARGRIRRDEVPRRDGGDDDGVMQDCDQISQIRLTKPCLIASIRVMVN